MRQNHLLQAVCPKRRLFYAESYQTIADRECGGEYEDKPRHCEECLNMNSIPFIHIEEWDNFFN